MEEPKCRGGGQIKEVYMFSLSDFVTDGNGTIIRKKRKYGKFTRPVYRYDWGTDECNKALSEMAEQLYPKEDGKK